MMAHVVASDALAPWGQAAAIILALYLFLVILIGLGLAAGVMFGLAWLRQKSELLRQLRPQVNQVNQALQAAKQGQPLPQRFAENAVVSKVVEVPNMLGGVEQRVERVEQAVDHGSQRVADVVIEIYARTEMVKGMARAFFLPGLTRKTAPRYTPACQQAARERVREQIRVQERPARPPEQVEQPPLERPREQPREEPPLEQVIVIRR